ncbi:PREDICTED: golgin subfamily B member 1-like [Nanorana parkeri]|uniref:golgin subfamily B member 1-like n=1 Tax=Nanorana parkeri TaxID=125878 RepID=UPI000854FA0B|nr:PREDICTED: golgin subfamily B member 1-like [Nanorana parkeri]
MWNWYSGDGTQSSAAASDNPGAGTMSVAELTEQLAQTQQLVVQLKDLIREKDNDLRKKDQQLKEEKESSEAKVSKAKLQSKAKIASLTSQLEELKMQVASPGAQGKKSESKKGDADLENASANRGKILVLRKRVEELESQVATKNEELQKKVAELEAQRLRGSEMDAMLVAKEKKLAEKEAYIVDLQIAAASNLSQDTVVSEVNVKSPSSSQDSTQDLQILINNLNRKVGESEEKYSLLREQTESLKALLNKEKIQFQEKEAMYTENIRVYQNMILEKEKEMKELSQKHDQEIFKLAAKSDATADLHQLLKALKQKLHEEEEVLSGKNRVIDVLQKELDNKDQQIAEMNEKSRRLVSEKENLQSKLDAEKHIMRAQLKDMMERHETEMRTLNDSHSKTMQGIQEKHEHEIQEKFQTIQQLQGQLQGLASPGEVRTGSHESTDKEMVKLQEEIKLKTGEASKSDAKFLKMKAWSKSRIRQLEEELKIAEAKKQELWQLSAHVAELEEEKKGLEIKLQSVADLQAFNEQLLAKLVVYEEQQRKLQADLEQVAKRADSQTSESGSVDEMQNQLLEWHEMSAESNITTEQDREETSAMALRMAQIEEEREAMDSGQMELEEELSAARGLGKMRSTRRKGSRGATKLQDEFDYSGKSFEEQSLSMDNSHTIEGENMGGWWPEFGSPNSGLRAVVEELELERNQLQEQIMTLEERCQELEDRLQLQLRIESLQGENERLQTQVSQMRQQQNQESEKYHELISTLNGQLKGLANRNAFLENAIVEKEQTILEATSRLDQLGAVWKALQEKETINKELLEKLDQSEHQLEEVKRKQRALDAENSALKQSNSELNEKVTAFKERVLIQDSSLEKLQVDLDQTNEDLDRLNSSHLEERSQLIYDLQRCEREMDVLKELLQEKDKEMSALSVTLTEYSEQITVLKETIDFKDGQMREMSDALVKIERAHHLIKEAQTLDVHETSTKISMLTEHLSEMDEELNKAKSLNESKTKEAEELIRQINENGITIKNLRQEIQTQSVTHNNHVSESSVQIASFKEQMNASAVRLSETESKYKKEIESLKLQLENDHSEKARLETLLEEKSSKEQSFENELKATKEQYNHLFSDMSKKDEEVKRLSKHLTEQKDLCDKLSQELSDRQDDVSSLKKKIETLAQEQENLVKALQEKTLDFQKQIDEKSEIIKTLHSEKKDLQAQCKVVETSISDKESCIQLHVNSIEQLGIQIQGLEDQNQRLCNEKENLLTQVSQKDSDITHLNQTLNDFQTKLAETERQLAEECKNISILSGAKEELLARIEQISTQSSKNDSSFGEQLKEREKECLGLKSQLHEELELSHKLQNQIQSLEKDLEEAQRCFHEKDDNLKVTMANYNTACENVKQQEEANGLLQKQMEELTKAVENERKALQERDVLLSTQNTQLEALNSNLEKLQKEEQSLKETNVKLAEDIEGLNRAMTKLQEEVNHRTEENTTLRERLEMSNKDVEKLTLDRDSSLLSISSLESQCHALQSQVVHHQSVVASLTQQVNSLISEKEKMNSDIELLNAAMSSKLEEINVLSSHLSEQGHTILSLKDQIDTIQLEKQSLLCGVAEKDALLSQKEELFQQVEKKLEGEGYYLQTISALQNELQSSRSENALLLQKIKDQEQEMQRLRQQIQLLKDKNEEAELLKTQLSEHMEIISNLHSQMKNLRDNLDELNNALTKKDECLKEKVDSYVNLKTQFSEIQDSLEEQKAHVEELILENTQYKASMSEKDLAIRNSLIECDALKQKLTDNEGQCNMLIQQIADLEEVNRKQNNELNELKVSIKEQETSLLGKQELLNTQLEEQTKLVSHLQNSVHELNNTIKDLQQSVVDKENTVQNLQEKHTSLYDHKQELAESLLKKENDISKLLSTVDEKDARLQVLESNVQAFTSEVSLLREELDKGNSNAKSILDTLRMKDEVISQHQKAVEVLKAELEKLKTDYKETQIQFHALTQEKEESRSLSHNLQEKCNLQSRLIENFKHDVESLNSEVIQARNMAAFEMEQFQHQLETVKRERLHLEATLQMSQAEKDKSLFTLEKQLFEKAENIKQLEEKLGLQLRESEERISSDAGVLYQLKSDKADLQKQVSGQDEEIHALKVCLETVECKLSDQKQQSEKEYERINEQNAVLKEQISSLDNNQKVKENEVQGLLRDLSFVEEQLCVLSDEKSSEYNSLNQQLSYSGKVETLSSMLSKALDYKSKVAELMKLLEARDQDLENKSEAIVTFEKESKNLQAELQKIKEEKLGSDYAVGELAAAKEALSLQQNIIKEKEEVLAQMGRDIVSLQEEIRFAKEELQKSQFTVNEEKAKALELAEEVKMKNLLSQNLNLQLSQQKELISTISDQVKEKDSSLMQVMESMSNEMVKFSAEKSALNIELQNLQSEKGSCLLQISELSEKLQAYELKFQQSEQMLADKELILCNLSNEKDLQLEKFNKERENLKRKLQAALVIRKDLMQKLEKLEKSKQDDLNVEQLKMVDLEKTVEELNCRVKTIVRENEDLQTQMKLSKQQILERDAQRSELCSVLSEKEHLVIELQNVLTELQQGFSEKESLCQEYMKTMQEKEHSFSQAKNTLKEKLKTLEEENSHLVENLENLKSCLEKAQGKLDSPVTSHQVSANQSPAASTSGTPESGSIEVSFAPTENTIVHNNVHASLLCTQGNVESKKKHAALLESLSRSVKEFELLQKAHAELQVAYKTKCAEYEEQREQALSLQNQIDAQEALVFQKELELADKDKQVGQLKQNIEEVSNKLENIRNYENANSELEARLHEKDEELLKISSEQIQLLSEIQLLKNEIKNLSYDVEQRQEEIGYLKTAKESQSMDLEKIETVKESMKNEIGVLQKEVEAFRNMNESAELTVQQLAKERDMYLKDCQVHKLDVTKLKNDLEVKVFELLEKDKDISILKDTLQMNVQASAEEIEKLCRQLEERKEEANKLRTDYDQMKEELEECLSKLEKAHVEISDFRTKLMDSRKEEEIVIQSKNPDLNQVVPETKPALDNLQGTREFAQLTCEDCLRKQKIIEEFESQVIKTKQAMEDLTEEHKRNMSEKSSSKEQIQRKLQAALMSRKDLLKENKALKHIVESLNLEVDGHKHSLEEIQEKHALKIALLVNKNKDLLSKNERLLLDNENLSAACESLKSTMESIVQEKEAFSFQLYSLKDSQTVELTGWKAKHGELNKEYESLLQAYENVSDEIDKMRQVIDMTKKEKHDILIKIHDFQNENGVLSRQIEENGDDIIKLGTMIESKDAEIKQLKQEVDSVTVEKASRFDDVTEKNQQLLEENRYLQETCDNLKLCLENKEKENDSLFIIKTALDKLQVDMNMYKSDMEIKISEMSSENEVLLKKITELSIKLEETEQSLVTVETERDSLLEKVRSSEVLFTQDKEAVQKLERDLSNMQLEKMNLEEKVKILEDDKTLLLDEIENIQEQFFTVKNERESMETELLKAVKNNSLLSDKFKSLQAQTNVLSQQVEHLRSEKNNIMREREEQQLQALRDLEEKVKSAQDDDRGTQSKSKELQELLKEKQQEINQLQHDSIRFQELIIDLESTIKGSNSQNEILKKELEHTSAQLTQARNDVLSLNKELSAKENDNSQITKLGEFREINGKWIVDNPAQNEDRKNMSAVTAGSGGITMSLNNVVHGSPSNRNNQDCGVEAYTNGVKRGVEEPEPVSQSRAEAQPTFKPAQVSHQQMSESPRDELKTLQTVLSNKEEELRQLRLKFEKIRADVQKHVVLSQHMKQIINNKDKEISLLISEKDGGVSSYLEEIQSRYRKQEGEYEQRLSSLQAQKEKSDMKCQKLEKDLQNLQATYEKALHDKLLLSNEIEAFRKSMCSLQTDRDQLCSELQSIHQRDELALSQKDNIIISTSAENNALKAQLRNVLNRVDDLNAENAMLGAQLIRYREDLNQVLSLKDHQLKELLRQKLDHIKNLEQEKCDLEKLNRELQNASAALQSSTEALELENWKLISKVKDQEDLIATINKEKIIFETSQHKDYQNSADRQIKDLEDKFNHNIVAFGQNTFLLGGDSSKMAEKTEKTYSDILLENKEFRSQIESFRNAMAALQNNRDSLIDDFKELQWRYASELKSEKIRGDKLERQLRDFKFQLYSLLKKNSLVDEAELAAENQITVDQLVAEIDSVCNLLANRASEITRLSSDCAAYMQQVDAFSKAMASLQHDRERLLQQLKEPTIVRESKQGTASVNQFPEFLESDYLATNGSQPDKLTLVAETMKSSAAESLKLRKKVQELERLLQDAESLQGKLEKEIKAHQCELAELRSEKNVQAAEVQSLHLQFNNILAEKDRRIADLQKHQETSVLSSVLFGAKGVEKVALVGNSAAPEKRSSHLEDKEPAKQEVQRYIQEIQQRDLIIQQINAKAMELMEMNNVLSAQLKSVSQGLKDTQTRYTDLQNQYYKLQRDLQSSQVTSRNDALTEVPPGAPQERTDVLVEIDNAELADLRRRLTATEVSYDAAQQELSELLERLAQERVRREAAEEALHRTEQNNRRLETKSSSREYEFALQMESDDEREALIIDPTQNVVVRKLKGGTLSIRRWLRGRSLYCSKLLTSRSKARYVFLTYLLGLHILVLMCLTGVL